MAEGMGRDALINARVEGVGLDFLPHKVSIYPFALGRKEEGGCSVSPKVHEVFIDGCYSAGSGGIELVTPKSKTTGTYKVQGDHLELVTDGQSDKSRRTDAWYPLDQIDYQPPK